MKRYAVVVPRVDTNLSFSHPTLYVFKANSDEEALAAFLEELQNAKKWWMKEKCRVISGGVNWSNVCQLFRDDGKRIDTTKTESK
jgi:hypothetical protein